MRSILTRVLLLLLLFSPLAVATTNLTQCLTKFTADPAASGGVDYHGNEFPANKSKIVGFTYDACKNQCGTGPEGFDWGNFAQLFSSWLLPWLALLSTLPFGSGNYPDDFLSVIITMGSPALAAYSLVLTALNARSVYRRTSGISTNNRLNKEVADALISLQQTPLQLTKDPKVLHWVPIKNNWRREIAERLSKRNSWGVAAATNVAWVVVAYLFTLVSSFVSLGSSDAEPSQGQAVGTLWLWLLCLAVGWLWVPTFSSSQLAGALHHANTKHVEEDTKHGHSHDQSSDTKEPITEQDVPNSPETHHARAQGSIYVEGGKLFIRKHQGSLTRDEHRLSATFNYSRVMGYLVLVEDVVKAMRASEKRASTSSATPDQEAHNPTFPPGAFAAMFNATIFAVLLQAGVTAAATGIVIFTPTVGLGCRSLAYIVYGGLAVVILVFTIISTICARISETRKGNINVVKNSAAFVAITLRRICLLLAFINAVGLILVSCLQFSSVLDNCYCNASVLGRGENSYVLIVYSDWFQTMKYARIAATVVAGVSMFIYMIFLWLMSVLPAEAEGYS